MPTRTWYMEQFDFGGGQGSRLWWGRDLSSASPTTISASGWQVGKTGANNYRLLQQGSEVTGFSSTVQPDTTSPSVNFTYTDAVPYTPPNIFVSTDSISTFYEYNGVFPAGTWTFDFPVIAQSSGGDQDGNIRMRVFKGTRNATDDGWDNVTELTSAVLVGTTVTNLTTAASQTSTITWSAPAITLNNEYLICKIAWFISGAGGANTRDVRLMYGQDATMTTPVFKKRQYNIT